MFDCSAKFDGVSLNDKLLLGPDLVTDLLGVLMRFRQEAIAVVADIKACFHQVFVAEEDRDAFRFLWFDKNDPKQPPVDYRMNVHIFRAAASPSVAAFALRRTALDNDVDASSEAVQAVLKNIYVDDLCVSCAGVQGAISLIQQLRQLLGSGGFHLTKFLSNSKQVLNRVPKDHLASDIEPEQRKLPTHKALGVYWNAESDCLEVRINIRKQPCTRRGVLSMIGQCYDPLGILGPFLLPARKILQEACRLGLAWDEPFSVRGLGGKEWDRFVQALPHLEDLSLARSFTVLGVQVKCIQLHVFCDASSSGYGACVYVRVAYDDCVKCSLVIGKSRVAPLKGVTVPRLELTAAVLLQNLGQWFAVNWTMN